MIKSNKLDTLTFLRFVAASLVVMFHYGTDTIFYQSLPNLLKAGPLMVTFFFVLSGFVISISHYNKPLHIGNFYLKRFLKIFPAYFISLIIYTMAVRGSVLGHDFFFEASMIQAWIPSYALVGNAPAWSISVEVFFYVVAPAMIVLSNKGAAVSWKKWLIGSILFWLVSQMILSVIAQPPFYTGYPSASHDLVYYFPGSHFCSFLLGFAGGLAFRCGVLRSKVSDPLAIILLIVVVLLIDRLRAYSGLLNDTVGYKIPYMSSFYSILFLPIIYLCAMANKTLVRLMVWPFMVLLGEASYAIYILQMPVHLAVSIIFPSWSTLSSPSLKFTLFFLALAFLSIVLHKFVELPVSSLIKKKKDSPVVPLVERA
jgi:peptidoglycan/LPS O-acetylase OafA/YrhL